MATFLRPLSYRYQWLYDSIARTAALTVGGEKRFRPLALNDLTITPDTRILDLCCGSGQTTRFLTDYSNEVTGQVTGLDASPLSIQRAKHNVPTATFVKGWAEDMPLENASFDLVHTSAAMHEMEPAQRRDIFQEVWRVLVPGGTFAMIDFHQPQNPIYWPGLATFLWLFETHTAWELLQTDVAAELRAIGFDCPDPKLYAGGSLQVIQAKKSG